MVLLKEIEKQIKLVIRPYEEVLAVVLCDAEGANVTKVIQNRNTFQSNGHFNTQKLISCAENLPKLSLGECRRLQCTFEHYKVSIVHHKKLILTIFCAINLNSAVLKTLELRMIPICDKIDHLIKDLPPQ